MSVGRQEDRDMRLQKNLLNLCLQRYYSAPNRERGVL